MKSFGSIRKGKPNKINSSKKLDGDAPPVIGLNNQNNYLNEFNNFSLFNNNNSKVDNSQKIKNNKEVETVTAGNINPNEGGENRIYENKTSKGNNDNDNIDLNIGENELSKGYTNAPSTNSDNISRNIGGKEQYFQKPSNIEINVGGNKRYNEKNTNKPSTNTGNAEINVGGNKRYNEEYTNKPSTNTGNAEINVGGNKRYNEEYINKPSTNTNKTNKNDEDTKEDFTNKINYLENTKYDDEISSLSQSIVSYNYSTLNFNEKNDLDFFRSYSDQKIRQGYFPLFLKVNKGKKYFFFVKQDSTLKMLLDYYKYSIDNTTIGKNINLFIEGTNNLLDQDIQIKNLNIRQFSMIEGYLETLYF